MTKEEFKKTIKSMTIAEAMRHFGRSRSTIKRLAREADGKFKVYKPAGRPRVQFD